MPGADEIRSARDDAPPLPGDVQVRRRWTALAVAAVAVSVGLGAAHNGGESARHPPVHAVGSPTPTPGTESTPRVPPPVIWVDPRPRTLAAPVEIRPVLREYLTLACPPAGVRTVPAAAGTSCYRLGPASLVIHKVRHLIPHRAVQPDGTGARDRPNLHRAGPDQGGLGGLVDSDRSACAQPPACGVRGRPQGVRRSVGAAAHHRPGDLLHYQRPSGGNARDLSHQRLRPHLASVQTRRARGECVGLQLVGSCTT
jgi:hypothetical protein